MSLLSRGAWIEMSVGGKMRLIILSLLSRGAWIEITIHQHFCHQHYWSLLSRGEFRSLETDIEVGCRSSHEERGLKFKDCDSVSIMVSRSSHEERGLK